MLPGNARERTCCVVVDEGSALQLTGTGELLLGRG